MKKILGNPILVVLGLIVFPPLGVFMMFYFTEWANGIKIFLAVVSCTIFIVAVVTAMQQEAQELAQQAVMQALVKRI